jgi:hypothetical protein
MATLELVVYDVHGQGADEPAFGSGLGAATFIISLKTVKALIIAGMDAGTRGGI